jgi:hypothetical protein
MHERKLDTTAQGKSMVQRPDELPRGQPPAGQSRQLQAGGWFKCCSHKHMLFGSDLPGMLLILHCRQQVWCWIVHCRSGRRGLHGAARTADVGARGGRRLAPERGRQGAHAVEQVLWHLAPLFKLGPARIRTRPPQTTPHLTCVIHVANCERWQA